MKKIVFAVLLLSGIGIAVSALMSQQQDYESIKKSAEDFYKEGSFARSHELYLRLGEFDLSPPEKRWIEFRTADTLWRSEAAAESADTTKIDEARSRLEKITNSEKNEFGSIRAEAQESLGDFHWQRPNLRNWSQAWPYYQSALDWWAGSDDIDTARVRYLAIVRKLAEPSMPEPYYYYGYYGNQIPINILENALKISTAAEDKAHLHYLIAMTLRYQGGQQYRMMREFEEAIKSGKSAEWHDDALYHYGEWLMGYPTLTIEIVPGTKQNVADFEKALKMFRALLNQYSKGESRYYDQAERYINDITRPSLSIAVSNIFIPNSEIQYHLSWRNVKNIELSIYRIDLTRDVLLKGEEYSGNWLQAIETKSSAKVKSWNKEIGTRARYVPGRESLRLDTKLPAGAYIIEADSGDDSARDLILVTDTSLVIKTSGKKALLFFCEANTGTPISNASVSLWTKIHSGSQWQWRQSNGTTGADGLLLMDLPLGTSSTEIFAAASKNSSQAFTTSYTGNHAHQNDGWKIYAFTDRPAYRPEEEVQWKLIARRYDGSVYSNPSGQKLRYEITDPRGTKVSESTATLNAFGSAWGTLELNSTMPLGEYTIIFYDIPDGSSIGHAVLFRLEEYKLPEFKVSIQTPEENGRAKTFRPGETIEVSIQADYYFGGGVANASAEILVYQNPFYHWWMEPREYPWFYKDSMPDRNWYGQGQIVKRETLKTDASGKASIHIDTPYGSQQDLQYRIEARITDSSRREIIGSGTVQVTRQPYFIYPKPDHYLYRPQDQVAVKFKALDANNQPVSKEGEIKITRDFWFEVWISPEGKEVKGKELDEIRSRYGIFPPVPVDPEHRWTLKFRGYQHDDILTTTIKTNANGEADLTFTPDREGYYRIGWKSEDAPEGMIPVTIAAETAVWVATNSTTELGYRHGGLQIIVDQDTFKTGQKAPVMLHTPASNRYVLFSVEADDLYSYQVVHIEGTVKLLEIPIEEKHVPNIFLSGTMVSGRQIFQDTKEVIVPPVKHFLQVKVEPDRKQYQPREDGSLLITTLDHEGKPVQAEIALASVDESVYYIQEDYAGDPRSFYYGNKRAHRIQSASTFQMKSYADLKELDALDDSNRQELRSMADAVGGVTGATPEEGYALAAESPAPAPPPPAKQAAGAKKAEAPRDRAANQAPEEPAVQVRSDFRSTIFWQPDIVTGKDGTAKVRFKYPDSLTTWKAVARAAGTSNEFGIAETETKTNQPLIVRLQAPRFFVAGDTITISAVINNNTDEPIDATTTLEAEGLVPNEGTIQPVKSALAAGGEARADWTMKATRSGPASLKVTSRSEKYSDAMQKSYPVFEHGIEKYIAKSGKLRGDDILITLDIPSERKKETTQLNIQVTPSMAVTMLDSLPYLLDYPYGCTEQTMSRFLPAVIVGKTLKEAGIKTLSGNYGGIVEEHLSKTHPEGKRDLRKLDEIVKQGLDRLYNFQHSDGGWGWWKDGESDHYMTAYVVWGFTLAKKAGIEIRNDAFQRGADFLNVEIVEEEANHDQQAWMLHAISAYRSQSGTQASEFEKKALENLWKNRNRMNAYTRSLLALSAHHYGDKEKAVILARNLENGAQIDRAPDTSILIKGSESSGESVMATAHWGEEHSWWRWSEGAVESTAFVLRALVAIDPENRMIEPSINWLIKNRRGAQWSNTRDTAIALLTLSDYLGKSAELKNEMEYQLSVNGKIIATKKVTPDNILSAPSIFAIDRSLIRDGKNEIRIQKLSGEGPLYFAAHSQFFSQEEPLTPAGNEVFVKREYYRLAGKPTLLKGYVYDRVRLKDGDPIQSGDRIEVVVTAEAKNDYEYLVFEDLKPAGLEAVEVRSGESLYARELKSGALKSSGRNGSERHAPGPEMADQTGRSRWVYQELRDRKVAMFIDKLPQGYWEIRYTLRAEVPGKFHALPLMAHAMYVPEIRANSDEIRVVIEAGE